MRIEADLKLDYNDVLLRPKRSTLGSRKDVSVERSYKFRNSEQTYHGVPIMAANMDGVATFEMADELARLGLFTCLVKTYSVKELINFFDCADTQQRILRSNNVAYSMGITKKDFEKFLSVMEQTDGNIKYVCVDVANGYTKFFSEYIASLRQQFKEIVIIAGNVVTGDQTQELILSGADIVKVGIGPGSVCTTRIQTGVGYPQLSAVMECADAAHGLGAHIIADGGCTCPGDVAKAFGAGADFTMLGGMLAGHDEGKGKLIKEKGKKFIEFYGSSSLIANKKHYGGLSDYRSSEGRIVRVKYRGKIKNTILDILGGIRSSCTYVGAPSLKQLSKCTTFVRVTNQFNKTFVE